MLRESEQIGKSVFTPAYGHLLKTLRAARDRAGLSQRALAARLGEHHSWVAKVELGYRIIKGAIKIVPAGS